jgi:hypothetical protein
MKEKSQVTQRPSVNCSRLYCTIQIANETTNFNYRKGDQ